MDEIITMLNGKDSVEKVIKAIGKLSWDDQQRLSEESQDARMSDNLLVALSYRDKFHPVFGVGTPLS
jgi:hypothetical protein